MLIMHGIVELSSFVMEIVIAIGFDIVIGLDIVIDFDTEIGIGFEIVIDSIWKNFHYFDWRNILVGLLSLVRSWTAVFEVVARIVNWFESGSLAL